MRAIQDFFHLTYDGNRWTTEGAKSKVNWKPTACAHCFGYFHNEYIHKKWCFDTSLVRRKMTVLSVDGQIFMCMFGCRGVQEKSRLQLYVHFYQEHSHSELKKWGINREILAQGLHEDLGIKVDYSDKIEKLAERNVYGLNPADGTCE